MKRFREYNKKYRKYVVDEESGIFFLKCIRKDIPKLKGAEYLLYRVRFDRPKRLRDRNKW